MIPHVGIGAPEAVLEGERGKVWINDQIIGETFVDGFHDLVIIGFGKTFEGGFFDYVAEVWPCISQKIVPWRMRD